MATTLAEIAPDLVLAIKEVGRWLEIPGPAARSPEDLKGAPDALPSGDIDLGNADDAEGGQ